MHPCPLDVLCCSAHALVPGSHRGWTTSCGQRCAQWASERGSNGNWNSYAGPVPELANMALVLSLGMDSPHRQPVLHPAPPSPLCWARLTVRNSQEVLGADWSCPWSSASGVAGGTSRVNTIPALQPLCCPVKLGISVNKELSRRLKSLNAPVFLKEKIRHRFVRWFPSPRSHRGGE